jgi:hypothetical protein
LTSVKSSNRVLAMSRTRNRGVRIFSIAILYASAVLAQTGSAELSGSVRDSSGAIVPSVALTLRNIETGVTRTTQSGADGIYRFPALGPGKYTVRAEAPGFATVEVTDITLLIGQEVTRDLMLTPGAVNQEITVAAETPMVNAATAEVSGAVTQAQIDMLPINSRQYLSLALLLPGTTQDATRSFFATVNVGGSMSFNSTGNIVDGMVNNWAEDGEPRQDLPQDAVREFKLSNAQYPAEFGEATGGLVQVVTKSGTNQFHGTAFEFFRDTSLNARGVFEGVKPDYRRHQYGGSLGGPIMKDKMHFFFSIERTQEDSFYTVSTGLPQFYSSVEGTFGSPLRRTLVLGRYDWQLSNSQSLFVRWAQEQEHTTCSGCGGGTASAAGFDQDTPRRSLVAGHTWIMGPSRLNDFRFQFAAGGYYIAPDGTQIWHDPGSFPADRINRLQRTYSFPSLTWGSSFDEVSNESRWEFRDTFGINSGKHSWKFGADYSYMPYFEENTGNPLGSYTFSKDQLFNPSNPATIAALTGAVTFAASIPPIHTDKPTQYGGIFAQDEWRIRRNLTLNLGLRYERLYGCCNEDLNTSIFPVTIPYINVGKRGDWNNLGPRFGLAWDLRSNGKTVVRAGYGIYYGHTRVLGNLSEYRNFQQFSVSITNPAYPDPYQGKDPKTFITSAPTNVTIDSNDYRQPMAQNYNVGVGHQLTNTLALNVDGIYNFGLHDRKIQDLNPKDLVTGNRPIPAFGRIDEQEPSAKLEYKAVYVKLEKRYSRRYQYLVSYTFTHSEDNNALSRYLDPFNQSLDWGPSAGERRHALVASGSVMLPWNIALGAIYNLRSQLPWNPTAGKDLNKDGFNTDLVPGTTRDSGSRNLNLAAVNAWRLSNGLGAVDPNLIDSSRINQADARLSKTITLHERLKLDVGLQAFNLFNHRNLGSQFSNGRVTNALSAQFGQIRTARPNRQAELSAKFTW